MRLHAPPLCAAPLRCAAAAAARLRAARPQQPPRLLHPRSQPPHARWPRMVRPQRLACLPAEDAPGEGDESQAALPLFDDGAPDLDIDAAEMLAKPNIRRYASTHPALRFPLFLFYSVYDNEALRKLIWTFLMMMCFYNSYTIPVPGLMPHRMKHGFGMEHLSALFMQDPSVTFINIMYIGYEPFLFFYLIGNFFMSSPFGHQWRKGRSPQSAMDEIYRYARQAGFFVVLFKVFITQPFFRHIAMPAVKNMHWFEFFAVTGCPLLWGSTMSLFFLTEVTNTGLVDGFAMAISSLAAGMITQVVSNWVNAVRAGMMLDPVAVAQVCAVYVAHTALVVLLLNCQRRIELVYFARKGGGGMSIDKEEALTTYLPIKAVASGVMPILFADMIVGSLSINSSAASTIFYIGIVFSACIVDLNNVPTELAEMLTKMGTRVPGVRPGTATVAYLQLQQGSTRLFGACCFVLLIFVSLWFNRFLGSYAAFFSFTSNIILVATILQGYKNFAALWHKPKARLLSGND